MLLLQRDLARQYLAAMIEARQVQLALRKLVGGSPDAFADDAGVGRDTVYRVMNLGKTYVPRVTNIAKMVAARGLTLSEFFAQIEALPTTSDGDTMSPANKVKLPHAGAGYSISASGNPLSEDTIRFLGATIGAAIREGVTRTLAAREQTPAARTGTTDGDGDS